MTLAEIILSLTKRLYPKGRAFRVHEGSYIEKIHKALAISELKADQDALSILDSAIPDNDNFTEDDATRWEQRLGLITNVSVSLSDRKAAIIRKMNHPGTILARQSAGFLEGQLQLAGFSVFVYQPNISPASILGSGQDVGISEYSDDVQYNDGEYGSTESGSVFENCIANRIDESKDAWFDVGDNLRSTFIIGGSTLGSFANVTLTRKDEFRQLILKIKPVQTVGFLFVNYV